MNCHVYMCIILKWVLGTYGVRMGVGFNWLFLNFCFDCSGFTVQGKSGYIVECNEG